MGRLNTYSRFDENDPGDEEHCYTMDDHWREVLEGKANVLGVPGNLALAEYVVRLESRLDDMARLFGLIGEKLGIVLDV
jgi:hypothetical protein